MEILMEVKFYECKEPCSKEETRPSIKDTIYSCLITNFPILGD